MSRFTVDYCPAISEKAEKIISENITPSMLSYEQDSSQYSLDQIAADVLELLSDEDQSVINKLIDEKVAFIEF